MRLSFRSFFGLVLIPVAVATLCIRAVAILSVDSLDRLSVTRLGGVASLLLTREMGVQSRELGLDAPMVQEPDPESPLLRAALQGDTVAALGFEGDQLTLSVALAEGTSDSRILLRAASRAFRPTTPGLFHARTGLNVALFLRGRRALASPQDFGPMELPTGAQELRGLASGGTAVILPLGTKPPRQSVPIQRGPEGTTSAAELLVASHPTTRPSPFSTGGTGYLFLPLLLGALAWGILRPELFHRPGGTRRRLLLFPTVALPLAALWTLALGMGREVSREALVVQRRDLVRVLALATEEAWGMNTGQVSESTGFQALYLEGDSVLTSTIPPGPHGDEALRIPPLLPGFPSEGSLRREGDPWLFATAEERTSIPSPDSSGMQPARSLVLLAPQMPLELRSFSLALSVIAGLASILSLVFLGTARRS